MSRVIISSSSLISLLSILGEVGLQVFMVHGDVALALGADHTQLVVVLPDVVGYVGGIPAILTTSRAKRLGHFIIFHLSLP